MIAIKHYEVFEILLYFQVNKLTSYSFMDASKRYKTPGSETERKKTPLLLTKNSTSQNICTYTVLWAPVPTRQCGEGQVTFEDAVGWPVEQGPWDWRIQIFHSGH